MGRYIHHFFWKNLSDQSKGVLWAYIHSNHISNFGISTAAYDRNGPQIESKRYPFMVRSGSRSKGKKWMFTMEDGRKFTCRTHSGASYVAVKAWTQSWQTIPTKIEEVKKPDFKPTKTPKDTWDGSHKVYFVRLLAFEITAQGKLYYKIGKAKIVPKRVHQFGPCIIEDVLDYEHPREAFEAEASLHRQFDHHRIPSTELFVLDESQVLEIKAALDRLKSGPINNVNYRIMKANP